MSARIAAQPDHFRRQMLNPGLRQRPGRLAETSAQFSQRGRLQGFPTLARLGLRETGPEQIPGDRPCFTRRLLDHHNHLFKFATLNTFRPQASTDFQPVGWFAGLNYDLYCRFIRLRLPLQSSSPSQIAKIIGWRDRLLFIHRPTPFNTGGGKRPDHFRQWLAGRFCHLRIGFPFFSVQPDLDHFRHSPPFHARFALELAGSRPKSEKPAGIRPDTRQNRPGPKKHPPILRYSKGRRLPGSSVCRKPSRVGSGRGQNPTLSPRGCDPGGVSV